MKFVNLFKRHWHLIVLILFALTPLIWLWGREDFLINGLDTNFPLEPVLWLKRRFFAWYDVANTGSDFSSSMSGIFFHLVQAIPYLLRLPLQIVEILSLVFWFSLVVGASYLFIKSTGVKSKWACLVFVLIYSFNTYLFNIWENVKVSNLALYVSLPLFLSLINFYQKKTISTSKMFLFSVLTSLIASGAGINPAYFIALVFGIFVYSLATGIKKSGILFVVGTLVTVNLYWILPLFNNLFFQSKISSLADIGLTDWLDSLSENTNLLNVLRLQGAWDWYPLDSTGQPFYLPYVVNYFYKLPFVVFSFALPTIAFISLITMDVKKNLRLYLSFAIFFLIGVFMGVGTHQPTGFIYRFLVDRVPFFSFFRSPWYIFTPYLILSYAGLAAFLFARVGNFFSRPVFYSLLALFMVGHLLYSYPLITGKIFRPGRSDGFFVKFPGYVWETEKWFKGEGTAIKARIITYPDDQVESFSWGYRGTDTILSLFSDHEFLTPSFNLASKPLQNLLDQFYLSIKKKNYRSAFWLMRFMGADTIFNRKDFISLSPRIVEADPLLSSEVSKTDIGEWSFLSVNANKDISKIFIPDGYFLNYFHEMGDSYLAKVAGQDSIMSIKPPDAEFEKTVKDWNVYRVLQEAVNETVEADPTGSVQKFILDIPKDGTYRFYLQNQDPGEVVLVVDSKLTASGSSWPKNNEFYIFDPINLSSGIHRVEVRFPSSRNLVSQPNLSQVSELGSLRGEELPADKSKTLVLYNTDQSEKRILIPTDSFDPFRRYVLSFDYKYFYGRVPVAEVIQSTKTAPVKTFPDYFGSSFDWQRKNVTINPAPAESKLEVFIILPKNTEGDRGKTFLENISLTPIHDNKLFVLEEDSNATEKKVPKITFKKESPVKYSVNVDGAVEGYYLVFLENYSPGWKLTSKDILGEPTHFSANGFANAWYIPGGSEVQKLTIYYWPQNLFYLGAFIFILLQLGVGVIWLIKYFRKN